MSTLRLRSLVAGLHDAALPLLAPRPGRSAGTVATLAVGALLLGTVSTDAAQAQAPPEPRYTIMFRDVPLAQALSRVAEATSINVVYDSELVAGVTVYCSTREATEEALLDCLLRDVPIDYYQTSTGTYVLTSSPRGPPRRGNVIGRVVDRQTGEPLSHAHVLLASANTGVASDPSGRFRLPNLESGVHRIVTTHLGYETAVDSIRVTPGDSVHHRVALSPTSVLSEPIIIRGVERRGPSRDVGASTVAPEDLARTGRWGTADALGATGTVLGVGLQPPIADLHVQGGASSEHQVFLDGIPIRNPVTLRRMLGAFSPLALSRMTVHKAGYGVEHGSTISGVVSADQALSASSPTYGQVRIDPTSVNAEAHTSMSLDGHRSAQVRVAARRSVWDVYRDPTLDRVLTRWNVVDPMLIATYFDLPSIPDFQPVAQTASVGFSDLHGAGRIDLSPYTSLFVSGYRGRNHLQTQFVAEGPQSMLTEDRYEWANTAGQARLRREVGARTSTSLQLSASDHRVHRGYQMSYGSASDDASTPSLIDRLRRSLVPADWPDDRNRIQELAIEATASHALSSRHHLEGAVEVSRLNSRFRLGGRFLRSTAFDETRWQVSGHLRDVFSLQKNTSLTAGTRWTYIPARQTLYAEPRLSLHHEGIVRGIGAYAARLAGGLYRQFVNRYDASSTSPTATLPSMRFWLPTGTAHAPPRAYHVSADGHLQIHDRWAVGGELYYKRYAHLLALDYGVLRGEPSAGLPPAEAIASADGYAAGGGLALTRTGDRLRSTIRYDWSRSYRTYPSRFNGRRVPVPWNQPHQMSLSFDLAATEALRLTLQGDYGWGRSWGYRQIYYDVLGAPSAAPTVNTPSFQTPATDVLPPHIQVDAGANYTVEWKGVTVKAGLQVTNLFDRENAFDWNMQGTASGTSLRTRHLPGRRLVGSLSLQY